MNKKLILAGFVVLTAFITLTAFGGKTKEQQQQEIAAAITAKLDEFRAQKQEECTLRVNDEAQRQFQEYLAAKEAEKPAATTTKKRSTGKTTVKKDPLPQPTTPTTPTTRDRGDAVKPTENRERGDVINPTEPGANRRRGDAVKKTGGN